MNNQKISTLDDMSQEEFDNMMNEGYQEATQDKGIDIGEAFSKLRKEIGD